MWIHSEQDMLSQTLSFEFVISIEKNGIGNIEWLCQVCVRDFVYVCV